MFKNDFRQLDARSKSQVQKEPSKSKTSHQKNTRLYMNKFIMLYWLA